MVNIGHSIARRRIALQRISLVAGERQQASHSSRYTYYSCRGDEVKEQKAFSKPVKRIGRTGDGFDYNQLTGQLFLDNNGKKKGSGVGSWW